MQTAKERYIDYCRRNEMPVFMQPWWLDAVCVGKEWDVFLLESEGEICGAVPYLFRKRYGIKYIVMPPFTQIGGVWLTNPNASSAEFRAIVEVLDEHIRQLHLCCYYQHFPVKSPMPFLMKDFGYVISKRVTYRIEDCSDIDKVVCSYNRNKQRQLRKSKCYIARRNFLTVAQLFDFHKTALQAQGKKISYSKNLLEELVHNAMLHQQGTIISLHLSSEQDREPIAAAFYVWDNDSVHYMIATQHPNYTDCGLMARLVTEGIRLAHELNIAFDFEGSMIPGVAKHFQQFGAIPVAYYSVERFFNPFFRFLYQLYRFIMNKKDENS